MRKSIKLTNGFINKQKAFRRFNDIHGSEYNGIYMGGGMYNKPINQKQLDDANRNNALLYHELNSFLRLVPKSNRQMPKADNQIFSGVLSDMSTSVNLDDAGDYDGDGVIIGEGVTLNTYHKASKQYLADNRNHQSYANCGAFFTDFPNYDADYDGQILIESEAGNEAVNVSSTKVIKQVPHHTHPITYNDARKFISVVNNRFVKPNLDQDASVLPAK